MPTRLRVCAYCVGTFKARRKDAQTCSPACRTALHRRTRGAKPAAAQAHKRRKRTSAARQAATGGAVVLDHRPIPRLARALEPCENGGAWACWGSDGSRWTLVQLDAGGALWLLSESVPDCRARCPDGSVRLLHRPGRALEPPGALSRRGAIVWALLRVAHHAGGVALERPPERVPCSQPRIWPPAPGDRPPRCELDDGHPPPCARQFHRWNDPERPFSVYAVWECARCGSPLSPGRTGATCPRCPQPQGGTDAQEPSA